MIRRKIRRREIGTAVCLILGDHADSVLYKWILKKFRHKVSKLMQKVSILRELIEDGAR